jgi:hypothetical protein
MSDPEVELQDVLNTLNFCLGRPDVVINEVLAILSVNAPQVISHFGLPTIQAWRWAGEFLGDNPKWPQVLVAAAIDSPVMGHGHRDVAHVTVMCATAPQASRQDLQKCLLTCAILRGVLYCPIFRTRVHAAGTQRQVIWNGLLPTGFSKVPESWPHYSGWILHLDADQPPGAQLYQV